MIRTLIQKRINAAQKNYVLDQDIPSRFLYALALNRLIALLRGFVYLQHPIALGKHVTLQGGKGKLTIGKGCTIESYALINAHVRNHFLLKGQNKIGAYSRIVGTAHLSKCGAHFYMGQQTSCGEFCYFGCAGGIHICDRTMIGQYVSFHAQEHTFNDVTKPISVQGTTEKGIYIGDDCWIGAKATILDGTHIGNHCVIAAGAVVKGIFPDNVVIGGVPAKIIRHLASENLNDAA